MKENIPGLLFTQLYIDNDRQRLNEQKETKYRYTVFDKTHFFLSFLFDILFLIKLIKIQFRSMWELRT